MCVRAGGGRDSRESAKGIVVPAIIVNPGLIFFTCNSRRYCSAVCFISACLLVVYVLLTILFDG